MKVFGGSDGRVYFRHDDQITSLNVLEAYAVLGELGRAISDAAAHAPDLSVELFINGVSVGELVDVTFDVKPWAPKLVQDRSCDTCGAKWLVWGDGSTKVESCFEHAHANKRGVGPHHCLCGHLEVDHGVLGAGHLACVFCPLVGDTCSKFTRCPKVDE